MRTIPAILLLSLVVGCAHTRTYQVAVTNHTNGPITFGLVKEGEPYERKWASPEQATINGDKPSAAMWGAIPPGRTAESNPVRGKFTRDSIAELRIYEGNLNLVEILAVSRGQPNRLDLPLHPGLNEFVVTDEGGQFRATAQGPQPTSPVARQ